jgi:hypothetical protein
LPTPTRWSRLKRSPSSLAAVLAVSFDAIERQHLFETNTTYVADYPEFAKHPDMRMRYFGPAAPTSTSASSS